MVTDGETMANRCRVIDARGDARINGINAINGSRSNAYHATRTQSDTRAFRAEHSMKISNTLVPVTSLRTPLSTATRASTHRALHAACATLTMLGVCMSHAAAQTVPMMRVTRAATLSTPAIPASTITIPPGEVRPDFEATAMQDASAIGDASIALDETLTPAVVAARAASGFDATEIAEMKAVFDACTPVEQEEMRAYYTDLGVDLELLFGVASAKAAQAQKGQMIAASMRELDFVRAPAAVLSARAQLGFGQVSQPDPTSATPSDVAKWIHLQVMAGEWTTVAQYLAARPLLESEAIYAAVLQAMNRGDTGLLPEEVLALAQASPSEFKPWQVTALGKMLRLAAAKYSTGVMLASIRAGTGYFGPQSVESRRRTVEFLAGAGLLVDAYEFLPSLEDARAAADGALMLVHARYKLSLAATMGDAPVAEVTRIEAWNILCACALLENETFENRRESMRLALELMNQVPRAQVAPWLTQVFASSSLGPAALEALALTATAMGDLKISVEQRAQAILGLKEAVDVLLLRDDVDSEALRVPLRMLTTALVTEMEQAVTEKGTQRIIARELQLLLRAIPSEKWLRSLEPSLATRARKACIALATTADETDLALSLLGAALTQSPTEAASFADDFLQKWTARLSPQQDYPPEMMQYMMMYRDAMPMAPLTRGRQHRNLDRLAQLLNTLRGVIVKPSGETLEPRDLPSLVGAFQACHAATEVYDSADITRIFGDLESMSAQTAARLAITMGGSLNGDWRSRAAQKATGTKRSDNEIAVLVDTGYALALELAESAVLREPQSWSLAVLKASLTFDRMQFNQSQKGVIDPTQANTFREAAFEAFAQAATRYLAALERGDARDDPTIHLRWFGAAMGTAELNFLRVDDLPKEGTLQDDQIELIRKSLITLSADAYDRHLAAFALAVQNAVERADPEVKPRLVHHALRVLGTHPAGASLRSMEELYRDLVKNEIHLRLTLDGAPSVGVGQSFALLLALRYTHSVDRETGGFAKYLQNGVYGRVGSNYQQINYRDQLQKAIERSLTQQFEVQTIGFFDPFTPARGVVEEGQDGWLEKPMAYLLVTRRDPSVDAVPSVVVDMQFTDQTGPVTLALPSNTPLLAASEAHNARPVRNLEITQLLDVRRTHEANRNADEHNTITLEIRMRGDGVLPAPRDVFDGLDDALAGYTLAQDAITASPPIITESSNATPSSRFRMSGTPDAPADSYPEPDADGMYRLAVEQTFTVTYTRTSSAMGDAFTLPTLKSGVAATLESRTYSDLDIVPVTSATVAVITPMWSLERLATLALVLAFLAGITVFLRRRAAREVPHALAAWTPARLTPLGVVTSLRRLERDHGASLATTHAEDLRSEITMLELKYFGPHAGEFIEADLRSVINRWQDAVPHAPALREARATPHKH